MCRRLFRGGEIVDPQSDLYRGERKGEKDCRDVYPERNEIKFGGWQYLSSFTCTTAKLHGLNEASIQRSDRVKALKTPYDYLCIQIDLRASQMVRSRWCKYLD